MPCPAPLDPRTILCALLPPLPATSGAAAATGLFMALAGVLGGEATPPLLSGLSDCPCWASAVLKADWPGVPLEGVPPAAGRGLVGLIGTPAGGVHCARSAATAASWHCIGERRQNGLPDAWGGKLIGGGSGDGSGGGGGGSGSCRPTRPPSRASLVVQGWLMGMWRA